MEGWGAGGDRPVSEPPCLSACSHVDTKERCGRCRCAGTQTACAVILWGEGNRWWWENPGEGCDAPATFDLCFPFPPTPDYFVDHMGDYEDVLASLETLNHSVLKAMGYTKKVSGCGGPGGRGPERRFGSENIVTQGCLGL